MKKKKKKSNTANIVICFGLLILVLCLTEYYLYKEIGNIEPIIPICFVGTSIFTVFAIRENKRMKKAEHSARKLTTKQLKRKQNKIPNRANYFTLPINYVK